MKEGYLLLHSESDEIHADFITKEHYEKIVSALGSSDPEKTQEQFIKAQINSEEAAWGTEPIQGWFTQTNCREPWPFNDMKILGTISIPRC